MRKRRRGIAGDYTHTAAHLAPLLPTLISVSRFRVLIWLSRDRAALFRLIALKALENAAQTREYRGIFR